MQPTYLPWLGYFDLIKSSNVFVFLDHVQFSKQSWQQRNKVRDKNGEQILTIPVKRTTVKNNPINGVLIDNNKRPLNKHLKTIKNNYAKSRNFKEVYLELEGLYLKKYNYLVDINIDLIKYGCKQMGITPNIILSSSLNVQAKKVEGIVEICHKLDSNHYLSPAGAEEYIEENNIFDSNNIQLSYQSFEHPIYKQMSYAKFISHLSFIDYLFNR
jgi:hypothetical protein